LTSNLFDPDTDPDADKAKMALFTKPSKVALQPFPGTNMC
jgi:hypothetical protein